MGIFRWGFRANVKVHSGSDSVVLKSRNDDNQTLKDLIATKVSLVDPSKKLWLNPLLFNGTLQTLYYASAKSDDKFLVWYGRELYHFVQGGVCSFDWVIPPQDKQEFDKLYKETLPEGFPRLHPRTRYFTEAELEKVRAVEVENKRPILAVIHGLNGGSHEPLIRDLALLLTTNDHQDKWDVVVLNCRGCCRTKITTGQLFTALSTEDVHETLSELRRRYPNRPIYATGFSFGAAMLANYLGGPHENKVDLKAVSLVGCPWDMVAGVSHMGLSWLGRYLFAPALTTFLYKLVKSNYGELQRHNPEFFTDELLHKLRTEVKAPDQFDDVVTSKFLGYRNALEYYKEASPVHRISGISVPTLVVNSTDDPVTTCDLPVDKFKANKHITLVETDLGGHLGYVTSDKQFWCSKVAEQFFTEFEKSVA